LKHFLIFVLDSHSIEPCEEWLPGVYNVTLDICNGECGSKHPHSAIYDKRAGSFQVTE